MVTSTLATAEDLWNVPNDDVTRYELIRGEIRSVGPNSLDHGRVANRMMRPLISFEFGGVGEVLIADTGYFLERDLDTVVAPDAAFVLSKDLGPLGEQPGFVEAAPALVIEVASPSDRVSEIEEKIEIYRQAGVPLIWFAFPRTRTVWVAGAGRERNIMTTNDVLDGGDVLPGLRLPVADIYR